MAALLMRATAGTGTIGGTDCAPPSHRNLDRLNHLPRHERRIKEAAMPLIYLPLILYAGWMEFMLQPLRQCSDRAGSASETRPNWAEIRDASA